MMKKLSKSKVTKKIVKTTKPSKKKVRKFAAKKNIKSIKKSIKSNQKVIKETLALKVIEPKPPIMNKKNLIGEITHFYPDINVGVVKIKKEIKLGDNIIISGHGKTVEQKVYSMQYEHQPIAIAKKGQMIGMKTAQEVKEKDLIYLKK